MFTYHILLGFFLDYLLKGLAPVLTFGVSNVENFPATQLLPFFVSYRMRQRQTHTQTFRQIHTQQTPPKRQMMRKIHLSAWNGGGDPRCIKAQSHWPTKLCNVSSKDRAWKDTLILAPERNIDPQGFSKQPPIPRDRGPKYMLLL